MIGGAILEFIVEVLIERFVIEGIGGLLRSMGALIRMPFHPRKRYMQLLREDGNGWYGLALAMLLIIVGLNAC